MIYLKQFKTLSLLLFFAALFSACKKEAKEPPFGVAALNNGRAAIQFTTSKAIAGSTEFNISNTPNTFATNRPQSGTTIRNVVLEATEIHNNAPRRKATISMALQPYNTATVHLTPVMAPTMDFIRIESFAFLGYPRNSHSGTITVTRYTASEIEGIFSASFDDGTVISNGKFAGKF